MVGNIKEIAGTLEQLGKDLIALNHIKVTDELKSAILQILNVSGLHHVDVLEYNLLSAITMKWMVEEVQFKNYADLCLRAALDSEIFSKFRCHDHYTPILEHVNPQTAAEYLDIIINSGYSLNEIFEIIEPLQHIGSPNLQDIGIGRPISTTALRYLKVSIDIIKHGGKDLGHVVEIGCGYGGQAIILSKLASISHYTFIDMWQVNLLIQRFIEESNFNISYDIKTIRQATNNIGSDFLISNYAFSELDIQLQSLCLKKFILNANHGYLTMNTGLKEGGFNGLPEKHIGSAMLCSIINGARQASETPKTFDTNYIIKW